MLLLVGLGNPGPTYAANRHNIGFMAADGIVRRHSFAPYRAKFKGQVATGALDGVKTLVFKPMTFMNNSGVAVSQIANFYKIDLDRVYVIYDELDLAFGKVRVKKGGGAGGHNGIRSIDAHLGRDYWRVRLGIGHPGDKDRVHGHVLSDFAKAEQPLADKFVEAVAEAAPLLAEGDDGRFMNKVSVVMNPPKPKPDRRNTEPSEESA